MGIFSVGKKLISEAINIDKDAILFAEKGDYLGGHLKYSVEKFAWGYICLTNDELIFLKGAMHNQKTSGVLQYPSKA